MEINLSSNFVGIFNTKSELIRTKAQIGDFAFVKDTKYTLIKYPYYKSKNWYKIKEFGGVKMELFASEKENEKMGFKRYGKTYKNAEEIYNFIKDKKGVVLISIDDLEQKDRRIAELESEKQTDLGYIDTYETVYYGKEINKLAEYENTGLEPKEIEQLKANQNKVAIEKLGELENWINQPYTKGDCYYLNRGATIETIDLQQKIKELKGDK